MIEAAWLWLRHQPESALTQWFHDRTQGQTKRQRRVIIVALARKLAIALWRYLETGLIPTDVIHDTLAHFRRVMEASRSGMVRRSFQAMQQASTMAS